MITVCPPQSRLGLDRQNRERDGGRRRAGHSGSPGWVTSGRTA